MAYPGWVTDLASGWNHKFNPVSSDPEETDERCAYCQMLAVFGHRENEPCFARIAANIYEAYERGKAEIRGLHPL